MLLRTRTLTMKSIMGEVKPGGLFAYPYQSNGSLVLFAHDKTSYSWGGTWPSGQRGALVSRRSQVRIPTVAVN
jgi:hypothetical protein